MYRYYVFEYWVQLIRTSYGAINNAILEKTNFRNEKKTYIFNWELEYMDKSKSIILKDSNFKVIAHSRKTHVQSTNNNFNA